MSDRAVFIGFGEPARGREERAVEVFNQFVGLLSRMQSDGLIESWDVCLLDAHGGDLGGFFMARGDAAQCAALADDEEFRNAAADATLIVDRFGYVQARTGEAIGAEMGRYAEAVARVGQGGHALAAAGHNGG